MATTKAREKPAVTAPAGETLSEIPTPTTAELADESLEHIDLRADEAALGLGPDQGFRWYLLRYMPNGKGTESCGSYDVGMLDVDNILEAWGPGRYHARLRSSVTNQFVRQHVFRIAAPRYWSPPPTPPAPAPTPAATAAPADDRLTRLEAAVERLAGAVSQRHEDPNATLDLALRMAERMAPPARASSDIDQVLKYVTLIDQLRGSAGGWEERLVTEGLTMVRPLVERITASNGANAPQTPAGAHPNNGAAKPENPPMLELVNWLQREFRRLLPKARAGSSASLYAELLLDNLPEKRLPDGRIEELVSPAMLLHALKQTGALDKLFSILPNEDRLAAQQCRPWFEQLQAELIAYLEEAMKPAPPDAPAGDTAGETGDTSET